MNITQLVKSECVLVPLVATERFAAIEELVDLLAQSGALTDRDLVLESVLARERTRSTGIGLGLAVPHGKSTGLGSLCMAIGKPATPIEFDSIDAKPCKMIVLLASPVDKTGPHIQALAGISRLWQTDSFRAALDRAQSADDVVNAMVACLG